MIVEKIDFNSLKIIDVKDYIQNYKVKFKKYSEDELNSILNIELLLTINYRSKQCNIFTPGVITFNSRTTCRCQGRIIKDALFDGRILLNGKRLNFQDRFFKHKGSIYYVDYSKLSNTSKMLIDSPDKIRKTLLKNFIILQNNL